MALTKIDIRLRNKVDIKNHYLCFFNVAIEEKLIEVEIEEGFFFFYNKVFFSFSCTYLMGTFKKPEYNPMCKVFTEAF